MKKKLLALVTTIFLSSTTQALADAPTALISGIRMGSASQAPGYSYGGFSRSVTPVHGFGLINDNKQDGVTASLNFTGIFNDSVTANSRTSTSTITIEIVDQAINTHFEPNQNIVLLGGTSPAPTPGALGGTKYWTHIELPSVNLPKKNVSATIRQTLTTSTGQVQRITHQVSNVEITVSNATMNNPLGAQLSFSVPSVSERPALKYSLYLNHSIAFYKDFCKRGDANFDGFVNFADIGSFVDILMVAESANPLLKCAADTNSDGQANGADISSFVAIMNGQ